MSPLLNSRRPASNQRSSDPRQEPAKITPWHLIGLGFVALLGTGILAAIDRSQERAATSHPISRTSPAKSDAQVANAAETQLPLIQKSSATTPAYAPAPPSAPAAAPESASTTFGVPPASDPPQAAASVFIAPAQAAAPQAPAAPDAKNPAAADPLVARTPQAADGPIVTASLAPAAAPAHPPGAAAVQGAITRGSLIMSASAPTDCLPDALRTVLADLAGRFGSVTVVSTHKLNTGNHSAGSVRAKLHQECKAVDIRTDRSRINEVKAYLRTRREIVGVESYHNGVIHMDVSGGAVASTGSVRRSAGRRAAAQVVPEDAVQVPAAPPEAAETASAFAPAQPDRSN